MVQAPWVQALAVSAQRRQQRIRMRKIQELRRRREYQRLHSMLPSIAHKTHVSKVTVIEEAIRYIDYLHCALLHRLKTKGMPSYLRGTKIDLEHMQLDDIKALVCTLVQRRNALKRSSMAPSSGEKANSKALHQKRP